MKEIWMPVLGYEGRYEASNFGRIKSLNYRHTGMEQLLRPAKNSTGYLQVILTKNGKKKMSLVHRLVWEAFNGPIPAGMQINHLNECIWDNQLENLSLATPKENINWGTGVRRSAKTRSKMVEQYTLDGVYVRTWPSTVSVENELWHLGYRATNISACCLGKLKTHKGYTWKYKE